MTAPSDVDAALAWLATLGDVGVAERDEARQRARELEESLSSAEYVESLRERIAELESALDRRGHGCDEGGRCKRCGCRVILCTDEPTTWSTDVARRIAELEAEVEKLRAAPNDAAIEEAFARLGNALLSLRHDYMAPVDDLGSDGNKVLDVRAAVRWLYTLMRRAKAAPQQQTGRYSDDRLSLAQEIRETLRARGHWAPNDAGPDIITAVGIALSKQVAPQQPSAAEVLTKLIDEMMASWEQSIESKKKHDVDTVDRAYWQGCANAEAAWIQRVRELAALPQSHETTERESHEKPAPPAEAEKCSTDGCDMTARVEGRCYRHHDILQAILAGDRDAVRAAVARPEPLVGAEKARELWRHVDRARLADAHATVALRIITEAIAGPRPEGE